MKIINLDSNDLKLIKRAVRYTRPYALKFVLTFLCILSGIGFGLFQPIIWGSLLKDVLSKNITGIFSNLIITAFLYLFQLLVGFLQSYLFSFLSENIVFDLKQDLYKKTLDLPVKAFDDMRAGDFVSRIHGDAATIANVLTNQMLNVIVDILRAISIWVAAFAINKTMACILLATAPITYLIFVKYGKRIRKENKDIAALYDNYFSNISESILSIREIKSLGVKKLRINQFRSLAGSLKKKSIKIITLNMISQVFSQGINYLCQIIILGIGGYFTYTGALQFQYYIAFSSYSNQFSSSLMNITKLNSNIQQVMTSLERVFSLMDNLAYSSENFGDKKIERIDGFIEFKNVSFEYKANSPVLRDISLIIPKNKITAIVGLSGSGKTTIFNLLLKFYAPTSGNIYIDNIEINEFAEESLQSNIGIVRQDPFLFNLSIKDNLLLANQSATDLDLKRACESAFIHEYIESLPEKYDSKIGENGINLSGGQAQRIAIARTILKSAKIILFDEATSSLDNESQTCIKKAIDNLSKDHTIVIIAHRLSTIIEADEIIVVENGFISGKGKHEELILSNCMYKRLYEKELDMIKSKLFAVEKEVV